MARPRKIQNPSTSDTDEDSTAASSASSDADSKDSKATAKDDKADDTPKKTRGKKITLASTVVAYEGSGSNKKRVVYRAGSEESTSTLAIADALERDPHLDAEHPDHEAGRRKKADLDRRLAANSAAARAGVDRIVGQAGMRR